MHHELSWWICLIASTLLLCGMMCSVGGAETSVFYPASSVAKARANIRNDRWASGVQKQIVEAAQPWKKLSDDDLWNLMFGSTIKRSWMVWSDGYCPACKKGVPMYTWEMDALNHPWKVRCPHCKEYFPKNDFYKFYRSGLDEHGVFDPKRADRSLLYNTEHPDPSDPSDPLHSFGVDDGEGYVEGGKRWRFIGAYLIYGQWKQAVYGGIRALAQAYIVTGDPVYARKAGILLDRVADLYPSHDFGKQGIVYEQPGLSGYVSTWHDACEETRVLVLAYDQVREALSRDKELVTFLSEKAGKYKLENPKASWTDIKRNIENGILNDALNNHAKIHSNYPRTEITIATIKTVLGWPENREEIYSYLDPVIERAVAVDGVTGEKGLAGYCSFTLQGLAGLLADYTALDPQFLPTMVKRHPKLRQSFRFHIDTHCLGKYYPQSGDTGWFAHTVEDYAGAPFTKSPGIGTSMFTFFRQLYDLTGDPGYIQVLYNANGDSLNGLPYDLFCGDPSAFQKTVKEVIDKEGAEPKVGNINKREWHLGILRSGQESDARALWLDYDAGGSHGHMDGLNLGLFAKGLDLLPDFGYPPVNFGGWEAPKAQWYMITAAHNTVVVDGQSQRPGDGKTTQWADGKAFREIRASAANLIGGKQFERIAAIVEVSGKDFYILDLFRVIGGTDHTKFLHSHFGKITTSGLNLKPASDYGNGTQMRNFACDPAPKPGWSVDWQIDDRYKLLPKGSNVHLRYTDLTTGAQAYTAEGWVLLEGYNSSADSWIPRVMTRRQAKDGELASTFVGVIEPYEGKSNIFQINRLSLTTLDGKPYPDANAAVEVNLTEGRSDLFVSADVENPLNLTPSLASDKILVQKEWGLNLEGEQCWVRRDGSGSVQRLVLCKGSYLKVGSLELKLKKEAYFIEVSFENGVPVVDSGDPDDIQDITIAGKSVWSRS